MNFYKKYPGRRTAVLFFLLFLITIYSPNLSAQKVSPLLRKEIARFAPDKELRCWLYLAPKPSLTPSETKKLEKGISRRVIERRRRRSRLSVVNAYDIPVNSRILRDLRSSGIKVKHVSRWLNAVSVEITAERLSELLSEKAYIMKADLVRRYSPPGYEKLLPPPEGKTGLHGKVSANSREEALFYGKSYNQLSLINVTELHKLGLKGKGIRIGILDTGFDRLDHESILPVTIVGAYDFVNNDEGVTDEDGDEGSGTHGRMVLSVIGGHKEGELIGSAYEAEYLLAKTENTEYERPVEEDNWIAGIEWAEANGADIVTSSLGYTIFDGEYSEYNHYPTDLNGDRAPVTIAADIAASLGVIVVNAAGNSGNSDGLPEHNTLIAPADGDSVITVGATDPLGKRISFSSVGPTADGRIKPDIMAQGYSVYGADYSANSYSYISGTSFATPITAGAAALILQANPFIDPGEMMRILHRAGSKADNPDYKEGYGLLNAKKAAFYYTPEISVVSGESFSFNTDYVNFNFLAEIYGSDIHSVSFNLFCTYPDGYETVLTPESSDDCRYGVSIENRNGGGEIKLRLRMINSGGDTLWYPYDGSDFILKGINDTIPPEIHVYSVSPYPVSRDCYIYADITDNLGVKSVKLRWHKNGDEEIAETVMKRGDGNRYYYNFRDGGIVFNENDTLYYRIWAADSMENEKLYPDSSEETRGFISGRGKILLVNDCGSDTAATLFLMRSAFNEVGFSVLAVKPDSLSDLDLTEFQAVAIAGADNIKSGLSGSEANRDKIEAYVAEGGGLFMEGKYIAALHYGDILGTVGGIYKSYPYFIDQNPVAALPKSPVLTAPRKLPDTLQVNRSGLGWYYPVNGTEVIYRADDGYCGMGLNYWQSGVAVLLASNLGQFLNSQDAVDLVINTVEYLTENNLTAIGDGSSPVEKEFRLLGNFPNPFNPETEIKFRIMVRGEVRMEIFNIQGRKIRAIKKNVPAPGNYGFYWNGTDLTGRKIASGIYFYRIISPDGGSKYGKMVFVK